jgi:hypothetical protein
VALRLFVFLDGCARKSATDKTLAFSGKYGGPVSISIQITIMEFYETITQHSQQRC